MLFLVYKRFSGKVFHFQIFQHFEKKHLTTILCKVHKNVDNVSYYVHKARNHNAIATLQKLCILALYKIYNKLVSIKSEAYRK